MGRRHPYITESGEGMGEDTQLSGGREEVPGQSGRKVLQAVSCCLHTSVTHMRVRYTG